MNLTYPYRLCTHIRGYHALLTEKNKNTENRFLFVVGPKWPIWAKIRVELIHGLVLF